MLKYLKKYWHIVLFAIVFPVLVNFICVIDIPFLEVAQNNEWIGFWGSIFGGIGTIVAIIANIEHQNILTERKEKLEYRVYLEVVDVFTCSPEKLKEYKDLDNSRLIDTYYESDFKNQIPKYVLDKSLGKVIFNSFNSPVFNVSVIFSIEHINVNSSLNYIEERIYCFPILSKDNKIIIPVHEKEVNHNGFYEVELVKLEIYYRTLASEICKYEYNFNKVNGNYSDIYTFDKQEEYKYINKPISYMIL